MALVIAVVAMGCTAGRLGGEADDASIDAVAGTDWQLTRMVVGAKETALAGQSPVSISLTADGKVSGRAQVNLYSGSVATEGGRIVRWGPFRTTRMAGPPELMAQEREYVKALQETNRFHLFGDELIFENRALGIRLEFVKRPEST